MNNGLVTGVYFFVPAIPGPNGTQLQDQRLIQYMLNGRGVTVPDYIVLGCRSQEDYDGGGEKIVEDAIGALQARSDCQAHIVRMEQMHPNWRPNTPPGAHFSPLWWRDRIQAIVERAEELDCIPGVNLEKEGADGEMNAVESDSRAGLLDWARYERIRHAARAGRELAGPQCRIQWVTPFSGKPGQTTPKYPYFYLNATRECVWNDATYWTGRTRMLVPGQRPEWYTELVETSMTRWWNSAVGVDPKNGTKYQTVEAALKWSLAAVQTWCPNAIGHCLWTPDPITTFEELARLRDAGTGAMV